MKTFISLICSFLIIGCSDSPSEQTPQVPSNGSQTAVETKTPLTESAPASEAVTVENTVNSSTDAAGLFGQKCASCHGSKGEKAALNKSQIIADFSEEQVKEALKGYQAGTYGKEMKALMQGQAKTLTDTQIDALAKYISAF